MVVPWKNCVLGHYPIRRRFARDTAIPCGGRLTFMGTAPSTPAAWWEAPGIVNDDPTGTYARVHSRIRVAPSVGVDPSTSKPAGHVRIVCISGTVVGIKVRVFVYTCHKVLVALP